MRGWGREGRGCGYVGKVYGFFFGGVLSDGIFVFYLGLVFSLLRSV